MIIHSSINRHIRPGLNHPSGTQGSTWNILLMFIIIMQTGGVGVLGSYVLEAKSARWILAPGQTPLLLSTRT